MSPQGSRDLSILYLRCRAGEAWGRRGRRDIPFNSLFEMRNITSIYKHPVFSGPSFNSLFEMPPNGLNHGTPFGLIYISFNSLFEMPLNIIALARALEVSFNSLFEMRSRALWLPLPSRRLSILYLRCRTPKLRRPPAGSAAFNSLFEMP